MRLVNVIVVLMLIAPAAVAQQAVPTPAARTLRGVVVTSSDVPLARVRVGVATAASRELASLGLSPLTEQGVLTDDRGLFTIRVPATASVRLAFTKARYVAQTADIPLREAAQASEIRVRMSLAGAISGRVLDRSGASLITAVVELERAAGPSDPPVSTTRTNDLGEYRFGGLAEGRYAVTARPSVSALGADIANRAAIVDAAAVQVPAINVSVGTEVANVDLTIDTPSELDHALTQVAAEPQGTGSVSGRVLRSDGTPIARAVVQVYRPFRPGTRQVETDARGRYRIEGLAPGEYTVEARKYGFDKRQYGQDRTGAIGRPVEVKNVALDSIDVTLTLERSGVIAGTIVDEFGEPAQDIVVGVLELQGRTVRALGGSRTDDRGQYRISGLLPGTYVVQAVVRDTLSGAIGYLPQFYPGRLSIDQATPVTLGGDAAVTGVDLALIATPVQRVTGTVLDSSGRAARGSAMLAVSQRSGAIQTEQVSTEISPDGSFEFTNVAPGDYVVQASGRIVGVSNGPDGRAMAARDQFATSFVTVTAGDPLPVQLKLSEGATLRGRVSYEGVPSGPSPILDLVAVAGDRDRSPLRGYFSTNFSMQPDGSFELQGIFGPTLLLARPQRNDWYLKSIVVQGQDVTDAGFDFGTGGTVAGIQVLISAFGATATGRVTDDRAAPARDSTVLVFSTFRNRWFSGSRWVKTDRSSENGSFTITGLPPGEYWVAAVSRLARTVELAPDPDLLESLSSRAIRIGLGEGQSQDLTLRLVRR